MRIDSISCNNKIFAAKKYSKEKQKTVIKPLKEDTAAFKGKKKEKPTIMPKPVYSFLLNMGQKRAKELELQAKNIQKDAVEIFRYSYPGNNIKDATQIISDGVDMDNKIHKTARKYIYSGGKISKVMIDAAEDSDTGKISAKQIFKFKNEKLFSVCENVVIEPDGTIDFQRKYKTDSNGKLQCVYNKIL